MHFSSINGEIREIPAEYRCENLFKLDLKASSISGEQNAFEGCSENQSEVFGKWLDENASEYLTEDEMTTVSPLTPCSKKALFETSLNVYILWSKITFFPVNRFSVR